jgi:excisionase family DNA binding protein
MTDALMTPEEVAQLLQIQLCTVYQWTHKKFIPHVKLGRTVRFRRAVLLDWIEKRSVKGRTNQRIQVVPDSIKI